MTRNALGTFNGSLQKKKKIDTWARLDYRISSHDDIATKTMKALGRVPFYCKHENGPSLFLLMTLFFLLTFLVFTHAVGRRVRYRACATFLPNDIVSTRGCV